MLIKKHSQIKISKISPIIPIRVPKTSKSNLLKTLETPLKSPQGDNCSIDYWFLKNLKTLFSDYH
jgi:hypothetical protein